MNESYSFFTLFSQEPFSEIESNTHDKDNGASAVASMRPTEALGSVKFWRISPIIFILHKRSSDIFLTHHDITKNSAIQSIYYEKITISSISRGYVR